MIKKNTKIIFDGEDREEELIGGIPLSKGDIIHLHKGNPDEITDYEVVEKEINFFREGKDQIANIIYIVKKK